MVCVDRSSIGTDDGSHVPLGGTAPRRNVFMYVRHRPHSGEHRGNAWQRRREPERTLGIRGAIGEQCVEFLGEARRQLALQQRRARYDAEPQRIRSIEEAHQLAPQRRLIGSCTARK